MKEKKFPLVSFILLTYNDSIGTEACLRSIRQQSYPKEKIEIIVVDDLSTDGTIKMAKKYNARVIINGAHDMYRGWGLGLHAVRGAFTYLVEQDIELRGKNFLRQMIQPLIDDSTLAASFTRKYPRKDQSWVNQFIAHNPGQADPLYEYFSPPVESTFIEKRKDYYICDYTEKKIPPISRMMYRMKYLRAIPIWNEKRFFDFETLLAMVDTGYAKYAYVPNAGIYHHHAKSMAQFLNKRIRNLKSHYIKTNSPYKYSWFDLSSPGGIIKIILWVIYANLFFPACIRGVIRAIQYCDPVMLIEPVVTIAATDVILYYFLTDKESRIYLLKNLFKK